MSAKQPHARPSGDQKRPGPQRTSSRNFSRRGTGNSGVSAEIFSNEEFQQNSQDRVLYLFVHSIGCEAEVQLNSGEKIAGIIESIDPKTFQIFLKGTNDSFVSSINLQDLIDFEIQNVDLFRNQYSGALNSTGSFKTDVETSISSNNQRRTEIEKWVPEYSNGVPLESLTLESGSNTNWDQFQTNQEKFGIKSEFDEHLYTTRINKNDPNYIKNLEKAERLAKEIEGQSFNGNTHLAEERGVKFDDSGIDEEDKYSGVTRTPHPTTAANQAKGDALFESLINRKQSFKPEEDVRSKYVPPGQRSIIQKVDPAIVSASKAGSLSNVTGEKVEAKPLKQGSSTPSQTPTPSTIPAKPSFPSKPLTSLPAKETVKKNIHKNELDSLKEFSQNFKIPSKFPTDLLPIVSKDKHKQDEIIKKHGTDNAPIDSVKSPASNSAAVADVLTSNAAPSATATPSGKATESPSLAKPKAEPSSAHKKFNPKATSFTPSSGSVNSPTISHVSSPSISKNSPRLQHASYKQKRSNYIAPPFSFFSPNKIPNSSKPRTFDNDEFNFFKGCLRDHEKRGTGEVFKLEKPFHTPPIWSVNHDPSFENPYKTLFAEQEESRLRQQQNYPYQYQQYPPQFSTFAQQQPVGMFPPPQQHSPYQQFPSFQQRFLAPVHAGGPNIHGGYQQQYQPMPFIQQPGSISPNQQPYYYQGGAPAPMGSPPPPGPPRQQQSSNGGNPNQPLIGQLSPPHQQQQLHQQQSPQFFQQRLPSNGNNNVGFLPPLTPPPGGGAPGGPIPPQIQVVAPGHPGSQGRGGFNNSGSYNSGYNGGIGSVPNSSGSYKGRKNNR